MIYLVLRKLCVNATAFNPVKGYYVIVPTVYCYDLEGG